MMKRVYRILLCLHLFVGLGAIFGGLAGMLNPYQPLGIPLDLIEGSPFSNYFVPSLILFTVIGLGHLFSDLTAWHRSYQQGYISSVFSWALVIWIVVQCIFMRAVAFPHVLYFLIGLAGAVLAMRIILIQDRG